jgi:hypothetical protein
VQTGQACMMYVLLDGKILPQHSQLASLITLALQRSDAEE